MGKGVIRVGQDHISYGVYVVFLQGSHQIYSVFIQFWPALGVIHPLWWCLLGMG
jgi:hypothetical protein